MTANEAIRLYVENYIPQNEQEAADRAQMLKFCAAADDVFDRENTMAHFTASSWIVDKNRKMALMIYHNLYKSWAWTGGHADGDTDLLAVALREAEEETGVKNNTRLRKSHFHRKPLRPRPCQTRQTGLQPYPHERHFPS